VTDGPRLFVALPVPDPIRTALARAVRPLHHRLEGLSWTRPDGWHVTLAFLGEVPAERVDEVVEVVTGWASSTPPMTVALGAAGRFDRHTLWVGVDDRPAGTVAAAGDALQAALADVGLPVQRRRVRPHLTLARGRARRRVARADVEHLDTSLDGLRGRSWRVGDVEVVRSQLRGGPARYHTVRAAPLGG
jgi:2'-5' RNA ligase